MGKRVLVVVSNRIFPAVHIDLSYGQLKILLLSFLIYRFRGSRNGQILFADRLWKSFGSKSDTGQQTQAAESKYDQY